MVDPRFSLRASAVLESARDTAGSGSSSFRGAAGMAAEGTALGASPGEGTHLAKDASRRRGGGVVDDFTAESECG